MLRLKLTTFVMVVVLTRVAPVAAEEADATLVERVEQMDGLAAQLFSEERYADALAVLQEAQGLLRSSARLYNMALCKVELGLIEDAIQLLEDCIAAPDTLPEEREAATARLQTLRRQQLEESSEPDPAEEPPPQGEPHPDPLEEPPVDDSGLSPVGFYAALGTTAALGITLAVLGGVAISEHNEFETHDLSEDRGYLNTLASEGERLTTLTNVFIGLTAAAATATLVLAILTNWGGDDDEEQLAFAPSLSLGGGQLSVFGRF